MYKTEALSEMVDRAIEELPLPHDPVHLYAPIRYILSLGGKRLRPVLVLMTANLYTDDLDPVFPAALSIELFHNFTLIHDDIMDEAHLRRNRPTVHKRWDEKIALLSGDALSILAYSKLEEVPESILPRLFGEFNRTALQVCEGQQLDMDYETMESISMDDYMKMIGLKTAALISGAMKTGAIAAGAPEQDIEYLENAGRFLGLAFQIQDDYLDAYGNEEIFGKKPGGDILNNKKTYLLVSALEKAGKSQRKSLLELTGGRSRVSPDDKIKTVLEIFDQLNIPDTALKEIRHNTDYAIAALKQTSVSPAKFENLLNLISGLINRTV